jgi:alcohol dehydrogenase class IV
MHQFDTACALIHDFKGEAYVSGFGVLREAGRLAAPLGRRALLIRDCFPGADAFASQIRQSLESHGVVVLGVEDGAAPNAPREDLDRIAARVTELAPDILVSFGGGSTIDAAKAAEVLRTLGGSIDEYFGTGLVTAAIARTGRQLRPHLAIQTAASSGAHLTKYSNITDLRSGQKKLIVDDAVVPARAIFDFEATLTAPPALTVDGALDGLSHLLEVFVGGVGKPYYDRMESVAREGLRLVMRYLPRVVAEPRDREARQALALATDLGGYAIMLGGTSGPHLTSFSLIDILTHGRACAMLNPYYTVFFAPAIERPLAVVAEICVETGLAAASILDLRGRELGVAVAQALMAFEKRSGVPTTLQEVPGFTAAHIDRALTAAKNPQLKMKLENMPVPLTADTVDTYMAPVLRAAASGDLRIIRNV